MKPTLLSLALLAAFSSAAAHAASPPSEDDDTFDAAATDAVELADTVVRPDQIAIERLANTKEILVITKADLEQKGNRTMTDALRAMPSINVGTAGRNSIDIRGQGSEAAKRNLQVLIDGAPITALVNHPLPMNYDAVPVEQLGRIEIIPGGGSVMYGSGAVGGVISMTSSLASIKETETSLWGEWNQKGYRAGVQAGTTFGNGRGAVQFTASKLDRDLYFINTYANTEYYGLGARWALSPAQSIEVRASHMKTKSMLVANLNREKLLREGRNYVPADMRVTIGVDERKRRIQTTRPGYLYGDQLLDMASLTYQLAATDRITFATDAFYQKGAYKGDNYDNHEMETNAYGLRNKLNIKYGDRHEVLFGLDAIHQEGDLDYVSYDYLAAARGYVAVPYDFFYERNTAAAYFLNTNRWGKWEFNEGVRYDLTNWRFKKHGRATDGLGDGEQLHRNTAFELSLAYLYSETGKLYARFERGFTLPDGIQVTDQLALRDASGKKYKVIQHTKADDEIYNMLEAGWRDAFKWTTVSLTAWYSQIENEFGRYLNMGDNGLEDKTINLYDTRRWGLDAAFSQRFGPITLEESYAYTMGRTICHDEAACAAAGKRNDFTDKGLMKVPKHRVTLRAAWEITPELTTDVTWLYFGRYTNFIKGSEEKDKGFMKSYSITNLSAHYKPNTHWSFYGGVNNVFDKTYYEYGSASASTSQTVIPGPGRMFYVGVKAIW